MTAEVVFFAHEGVGAGVERAQLGVAADGAVSKTHGVAAQRRSRRSGGSRVAPSMPGMTPSTMTAVGRQSRRAQPLLAGVGATRTR